MNECHSHSQDKQQQQPWPPPTRPSPWSVPLRHSKRAWQFSLGPWLLGEGGGGGQGRGGGPGRDPGTCCTGGTGEGAGGAGGAGMAAGGAGGAKKAAGAAEGKKAAAEAVQATGGLGSAAESAAMAAEIRVLDALGECGGQILETLAPGDPHRGLVLAALLDQLEAGQPPQKGRGGKKAAAAGGGKGGRPAWDAAKVMEVVEGFYGLGHIATVRPVLDGEETDSESESESVSDGFPAEGEREEFELPEEDFGHMMT